jgi:hypothetical protein
MMMLGKVNWWFPKRLDRLLPRVSFEKPTTCRATRDAGDRSDDGRSGPELV